MISSQFVFIEIVKILHAYCIYFRPFQSISKEVIVEIKIALQSNCIIASRFWFEMNFKMLHNPDLKDEKKQECLYMGI